MSAGATLRGMDRLKAKNRAIRGACKELGLDDATRRDLIERFAGAGKRSSLDLDEASANRLLDYLKDQGASLGGHAREPIRVSPEKAGLLSKIGALLADQKKPWAYAHAIAKNNFRTERVEWLSLTHLRGLIAQLSKRPEATSPRGTSSGARQAEAGR